MILIGFIKEHDAIAEAVSFGEMFNNAPGPDPQLRLKVLSYLDQGEYVTSWMQYVKDLHTEMPLCPHSYHTDGIYVWPLYFYHYIKKYDHFIIDEKFARHMADKSFVNNIKLNDTEVLEIERQLGKIIG